MGLYIFFSFHHFRLFYLPDYVEEGKKDILGSEENDRKMVLLWSLLA